MCLAHRSFVPICQKIIFEHVAIYPDIYRLFNLLLILNASPHLASYIRFLIVNFNDNMLCSLPEGLGTYAILVKINNLRHLRISRGLPSFFSTGYDWKTLGPQFIAQLLRLISLPSLESLAMCEFKNFPFHGLLQLKNSPSLRILELRNFGLDPDVSQASSIDALQLAAPPSRSLLIWTVSHRSVTSVEALTTGGSKSRYRNHLIFDLTQLRKFHTQWDNLDEASAGKSVIESAPNIEELVCLLPRYSSNFVDFDGLAQSILERPFEALRSLDLIVMEDITEEAEADPFNSTITALTKLSGGIPRLEKLIIRFFYFLLSDEELQDLLRDLDERLVLLDEVFANRSDFSSLHTVSIRFFFTVADDKPDEEDVEDYKDRCRRIEVNNLDNLRKLERQTESGFDFDFAFLLGWEY